MRNSLLTLVAHRVWMSLVLISLVLTGCRNGNDFFAKVLPPPMPPDFKPGEPSRQWFAGSSEAHI